MRKILRNIEKSSSAALFFWLGYLFAIFSSIIRYKYITETLVNFRIIGLLANYIWHLRFFFLSGFIVFLVFSGVILLRSKPDKKEKIIFGLLNISSIFTLLLSYKLLSLEKANYSNYLYSRYGLMTSDISNLSDISVFVIIISLNFLYPKFINLKKIIERLFNIRFRFRKNSKIDISFSFQYFASIIGILILVWFARSPITKAIDFLYYVKQTYADVYLHYSYIVDLKNYVPEEAKVILPPEEIQWPAIGNPPIVRYFLFPRTLISSTYLTRERAEKDIRDAYFVEIDGDGTVHWPRINMSRKTISFDNDLELSYKTISQLNTGDSIKLYRIFFY